MSDDPVMETLAIEESTRLSAEITRLRARVAELERDLAATLRVIYSDEDGGPPEEPGVNTGDNFTNPARQAEDAPLMNRLAAAAEGYENDASLGGDLREFIDDEIARKRKARFPGKGDNFRRLHPDEEAKKLDRWKGDA